VTIKERLLTTLTHGEPDQIPLTLYDGFLPRETVANVLRPLGVGLVVRAAAHYVEHREARIESQEFREAGRRFIRVTIHTPVGQVWQILEPDPAYGTSNWIRQHFLKSPADYAVLDFYARDGIYRSNYDAIREVQESVGDNGIVIVRVGKSPIQEMLYKMLGYERFAIDYYENRELLDSLHATMVRRFRELYDLAAEAPVEILLMGDNIAADVIGPDRFRNYLMPEYALLKTRLAGTGKLVAVHMDGRLHGLVKEIAETDCDIVEALTPPPMGNVSIRDARAAWPNKALWLNFTSSIHIEPDDVIEAHTRDLLSEAGGKRGFAIGVTEDAPRDALARSLKVIARVLQESR
jgi:hypothetical protein